MKTLTKTFGLSLIFASLMLVSNPTDAQAECLGNDCGKNALKADTTEADALAENDEFDFDFESPFFFSDKIVIHIYNQQDELIYSKAFSKEEADDDAELKAILKQSEFMLSIDNQYYYHTQAEALVLN